jgi:hypothetical protein
MGIPGRGMRGARVLALLALAVMAVQGAHHETKVEVATYDSGYATMNLSVSFSRGVRDFNVSRVLLTGGVLIGVHPVTWGANDNLLVIEVCEAPRALRPSATYTPSNQLASGIFQSVHPLRSALLVHTKPYPAPQGGEQVQGRWFHTYLLEVAWTADTLTLLVPFGAAYDINGLITSASNHYSLALTNRFHVDTAPFAVEAGSLRQANPGGGVSLAGMCHNPTREPEIFLIA